MTKKKKIELKNKILTDLYNSGDVHKQVNIICFKNNIKPDTLIAEDIVQLTFTHLSNYDMDKMIEAYMDNPKRILALACRIAINKGVASNPLRPNYYRHSLGKMILFGSNFQQLASISETEHLDQSDSRNYILADPDTDIDEEYIDEQERLWKTIRAGLDKEELKWLEFFLDNENEKQLRLKSIKREYDILINKIRNILKVNEYDTRRNFE